MGRGERRLEHSEETQPSGIRLPRSGRLIAGICLAVGISAAALILIVRAQPEGDWLGMIRRARPSYLVLCLVLLIASWGADAMRFRVLGRGLGRDLDFRVLVGTIMMGNFLTLSTPFMAGGAPALIYVLFRQGLAVGQASAVVVIGGVASQVALAGFNLCAAVALASQLPPDAWLGRAYIGFVILYFGGLALFAWAAMRVERLRPRLEAWLVRRPGNAWLPRMLRMVLDMLSDFRRSLIQLTGRGARVRLVEAVAWAALYFLLYFSVGLSVMRSLGVQGNTMTLFAWQVVAATIALFTPSPGGSGAAELGAMFAFGSLLPGGVLPAFIILWRFFTFHLNLLLGGFATALLVGRMSRQEGTLGARVGDGAAPP